MEELNKLLNEMDGLRSDAEILFVLTTNRPEALATAMRGIKYVGPTAG